MSVKPVVPRALAQADIAAAVTHYAAEGGQEVALRFIAALESAFGSLGRNPAIGSPSHAYELGIEGMRCWPLRRFLYLVFYREAADSVDVWRVLHAQRDIPAWMQHPGT